MEELLTKLLEQAPSTAAVIITVMLFLKAQKTQMAMWQKSHDEYTKVVRDNTKMLGQVTQKLEQQIQQIKQSGG